MNACVCVKCCGNGALAIPNLGKDFLDFLKLLDRHRVRHLLSGYYSIACHGCARATGGIGFGIACSLTSEARVVLSVRDFILPGTSAKIPEEQNAMLWKRIGGMSGPLDCAKTTAIDCSPKSVASFAALTSLASGVWIAIPFAY